MPLMHATIWTPDKHPRGAGGRFTDHGSAPSMRTATIVNAEPRRSLTRGESWQRTGAKIDEIPISYTGSRDRELPLGSYKQHSVQSQVPPGIEPKDHAQLTRSLISVIQANKPGTIARAQEQGLIPEGTPRRTVLRAYHHASMLALHDFGVVKYDFAMDDHLKAEMKPLVPFIRYALRRVSATMLGTERGAWRPYRDAFGVPFKTPKYDRFTGTERKRMRVNQELVKVAGPGLRRLTAFGG